MFLVSRDCRSPGCSLTIGHASETNLGLMDAWKKTLSTVICVAFWLSFWFRLDTCPNMSSSGSLVETMVLNKWYECGYMTEKSKL